MDYWDRRQRGLSVRIFAIFGRMHNGSAVSGAQRNVQRAIKRSTASTAALVFSSAVTLSLCSLSTAKCVRWPSRWLCAVSSNGAQSLYRVWSRSSLASNIAPSAPLTASRRLLIIGCLPNISPSGTSDEMELVSRTLSSSPQRVGRCRRLL